MKKFIEIFLPNNVREVKPYVPCIQLPKGAYAYRYFSKKDYGGETSSITLYEEVTPLIYVQGTRLFRDEVVVLFPEQQELILDMYSYNYEWAIQLPDGTILPLKDGDNLICDN